MAIVVTDWVLTDVFFIFPADINAIAKIYGKQITKNNEAYMTIEKMVVDFVMKGARFRVKDMGQGKSLSKKLWKEIFWKIL